MPQNQKLGNSSKEKASSKNSDDITFAPQKWLTDAEIDWALQEIKKDYSKNHTFISVYEWPLLKSNSDAEANARLFSELAKQDKELIFIPINNPNTHWSLLVYEIKSNKFCHLDSSKQKLNSQYIKEVVDHLCLHKNANFAELNVPCQPNSYDCGIYLITFVKLLSENPELLTANLPEIDSESERNHWNQVIASVWITKSNFRSIKWRRERNEWELF